MGGGNQIVGGHQRAARTNRGLELRSESGELGVAHVRGQRGFVGGKGVAITCFADRQGPFQLPAARTRIRAESILDAAEGLQQEFGGLAAFRPTQ
jgi:hypothetical protein